MSDIKEIELIKIAAMQGSSGTSCLIPKYYGYEYYKDIKSGETIICNLERVPDKHKRSLEQLGLFWKACDVFANNNEDKNWNTKEKVAAQLKFALKFFDVENAYWFKYKNQAGDEKEMLQFPLKSLSFATCKHPEACEFITEALEFMADKWKMQVDEFIEFVKSQMGS